MPAGGNHAAQKVCLSLVIEFSVKMVETMQGNSNVLGEDKSVAVVMLRH
jgi:hypothetical protein